MKPRVYDRSMEMVGVLENASQISLAKVKNDLHSIEFLLPFEDPKNDICDTHYVVEVFSGETSKGKYRILDEPETEVAREGEPIRYYCEHVIAFLVNDAINGTLHLGGSGQNTRAVIEALLALQPVQRWVLGTCDFTHEFEYLWENSNLLDAIFSIPKAFLDKYHWTYDTSTYPWTLNLVEQSTDRSCEIRRKKNMRSIRRSKDSTMLCTRLYCKGNGEGVNQLGIEDAAANTSGLPYIDADTVGTYGILASHFIDLSINNPDTLYAKGKAILETIKHPWYAYRATALQLSELTGRSWDAFDEGKYVHMIDEEKGIDVDAEILETYQPDIEEDPMNVECVISNRSTDVASSIEELARRTSITAQYSQGATNLYSQQYCDNADDTHPAVMRFYIPTGMRQIDQLLLSWRLSAFRAYAQGAEYGGGSMQTSTNGGGGAVTSESGGGGTTGQEGGLQTSNTFLTTDSPDTGVTGDSTGDTGASSISNTGNTYLTTTTPDVGSTGSSSSATGVPNPAYTGTNTVAGDPHSHSLNSHTHTVNSHTHSLGGHTHDINNHNHSMSHTHSLNSHSHSIIHTHQIQNHNHLMPYHTHTIDSHTHTVNITSHSHSVTIPAHAHDIVYGIYEGSTAGSVTVEVDGNAIDPEDLEADEMNIVSYLDKDANGKITRGTWHEVEITPNTLTRIEANLFVQAFISSYDGGNY